VEDSDETGRAEDWLLQGQRRLELINGLAAEVARGASPEQIVDAALRELHTRLPDFRAAYSTVDAWAVLRVQSSREPDGMPSVTGTTLDLKAVPDYLAALRAGELLAVSDVTRDERLEGLRKPLARGLTRAMIHAPLHHADELLGLICLGSPQPRRWSDHEALMVAALAEYLSLALKQAHGEQARARLQAELGRAAQEWTQTIDALATAIVVLDGAGRVKRLNRAALELTDSRDFATVIDRFAEEISSTEPLRSLPQLMRRLEATGRAAAELHEPRSGRTWLVTLAVLAASGDSGEERLLLTARDLTEIVSLQQTLARAQTMAAMGSLVAGVAHEVRNPLFSISATLDAFELQFGNEAREFGSVLRRSVSRLGELMSDLLEYGRPPSIEIAPGPLHEVVGEAVEACHSLALRSSVEVANRVAQGLPLVRMDRRRLALVFRNIVENAIHYSPRGTSVTVEVAELHEGGPVLECLVQDRGPGFQDSDRHKLFEPFFTRRRGGTGLGLAIAQRIVQEHHGSIAAFNRKGGGAVFSVRLPCIGGSDYVATASD
jgi:signal transduction histidine kinase